MAGPELSDLFKKAAEIASVVPESMQGAAFHRALDALTAGDGDEVRAPSRRKGRQPRSSHAAKPITSTDAFSALAALDRSRAEEVDREEGGLAKSLALLQVARRELSIDGLSSTVIARVLTEKFRWRVTRQAVNQALDRAGKMVDRNAASKPATYRIMAAGEEWLAKPAKERSEAGATPTQRASTSRKRK